MTDPFTLAVASGTAGLGGLLGWLMWPRAPDLDAERWFKTLLATLMRGEVLGRGGSEDAWADAVVRAVPYHPAGRLPERKVTAPGASLPGPARDGERALCEKLASLPSIAERWSWMYDQDEAGVAARLADPAELGPAYDPVGALGPGVGWETLEAWGAGRSEVWPAALARRLPATWVLVDGRDGAAPDVLGALARLVPRSVRVGYGGSLDPSGVIDAVAGALETPSERLVLVGADAGALRVLRALADHNVLRDRTLAVVSVGGLLGGLPGADGDLGEGPVADWMGAWFTHHRLDTEVTRLTPYAALQWLDRASDPPGALGVPLGSARFPEARLDALTQEYVQPLDLGPLPVDADPDRTARALWAFVTCWVAAASR